MLYKKYGVDIKTVGVSDVSSALHAVSEGKKGNTDWAQKLIEEKRRKVAEQKKDGEAPEKLRLPEKPAPTADTTTMNMTTTAPMVMRSAPKVLNGLKSSLMDLTKNEIIENQSQYTCPNYRYINKMLQRNSEIIAKSEKFVNPATQQELFFTDQGIFVYNEQGCITRLRIMNRPGVADGHGADQATGEAARVHDIRIIPHTCSRACRPRRIGRRRFSWDRGPSLRCSTTNPRWTPLSGATCPPPSTATRPSCTAARARWPSRRVRAGVLRPSWQADFH